MRCSAPSGERERHRPSRTTYHGSMIDAAGLRVMRAIAEEGSFTAAALALGYSQ